MLNSDRPNLDSRTVTGFGRQWAHFTETTADPDELSGIFLQYFSIVPWEQIDWPRAEIADFGCGSGRWARVMAPKVARLHAIDVSPDALATAKKNLAPCGNVTFHRASIEDVDIADTSLDFAFSLGVLHHLPNTQKAICDIVKKLKPRGWFLLYLYYAFDNRPLWYRWLWRLSDGLRHFISRLPFFARWLVSQVIAITVYWPLARSARALEHLGWLPPHVPLAYYRDRNFYTMRTDAFDRFCTPLEKRFSKYEIEAMLRSAGFVDVQFSNSAPYWCAVARKRSRHEC